MLRSGSSSRLYSEIISDEQRRQYKTEFDSDLSRYKTLCADMDELSDQIHQLSRELDGLDVDSIKYQVKTIFTLLRNWIWFGLVCPTESDRVCFHFSGSGRRVQQTQRPEDGEWKLCHTVLYRPK